MLTETRQALAAALSAGIPTMQVSAYQLSNPTPPAAHIFPADTQYDAAMQRGGDWWTFTLQAFVTDATGDIGSQINLDKMVEPTGATSVKEIIESDPTLGGVVSAARVTSFSGYRIYLTEGRGAVLGGEWTIQVLT